jgi:hypothetical protein
VSLWEKNPNQSGLPIFGPTNSYIGYLVSYAVYGTSVGIGWEQLPSGEWRAYFADTNVNVYYSSTRPATSDFRHIVVTFDNGTVKIYVDGQLDSTHTGSVNVPSFTTLGSGYDSFLLHNGVMDEVKIWNRTITANEVSELYTGNSDGEAGSALVELGFATSELSNIALDVMVNEGTGYTNNLVSAKMFVSGSVIKVQVDAPAAEVGSVYRIIAVNEKKGGLA